MNDKITIAIDGPSGAGKSTMARALSEELKYIYVDTGAIYRTVGLAALNRNLPTKDEVKIAEMLEKIDVNIEYDENGSQKMMLDGEDVSSYIRTPEVSMAASDVSSLPVVREFLLDMQRNLAETNNVIMDGRDIGTVVVPNARIKIFLTASVEDRAQRRYKELKNKGLDVEYDDVLNDIIARDKQDSERATAPLKVADDAVVVDTTGNTLEESLEILKNTVKELLGNA